MLMGVARVGLRKLVQYLSVGQMVFNHVGAHDFDTGNGGRQGKWIGLHTW